MKDFITRTLAVSIVLFCCLYTAPVDAQSSGRLIREGNQYKEHGNHRAALQYYLQGGNAHTWNKRTKLNAAICYFEINDLDASIQLLNQLVQEGKTDPLVYLYLARCFHHKNQFNAAVRNFKQFLRNYRDDDPIRDWAKDELMRCANGIGMRFHEQIAYVENMGPAINTVYDEWGVVPSPNHQNRIYFSSTRAGNRGGMFSDDGQRDQKYGRYRSDIYGAEEENGIWRPAYPMPEEINTALHEVIYGFSPDGQHLFYYRSEEPYSSRGDLMIDTFSIEGPARRAVQLGPFSPRNGDRDLYVFNDTLILFSSTRPGGYGGYDLYYSVYRGGRWQDATNLGPAVNSFYDEVSPFLVQNGRTLYFSSNRLESIGGLDVFRTDFDDDLAEWDVPVNLGMPVNSAGDDVGFRLSADGHKAYIASDRRAVGYGGFDLYSVYLRSQVREHLLISAPLTFAQVTPVSAPVALSGASRVPREVREYFLSDLWFEANDVILTPQNIKKLDVLANLLLIFPVLQADLICHDVPSAGPRSYELFFSVKKAEQAAQYLVRKGIDISRLHIKGCGAFYPLASQNGSGAHNPALDRFNRRIQVYVHHTEGQPVALNYEEPRVPEQFRDARGRHFAQINTGLVYRVQIANVGQLFQHDVFERYNDAMVHYDPEARSYRYLLGMEATYQDALALRVSRRANASW